RRLGIVRLAAVRIEAGRRTAVDRCAGPTAGPQFRAGDQRVLPDHHPHHAHRLAPPGAQKGEQPARPAQVVRRAVRTARAPAADSVSAAGDDGILMKTAPLEPRAAYELWADTYPAVAHNPLMRLEQSIVEPTLRQLRAVRALDVGTGSGRYLPLLRATGAAVVAGVDFSIAMLTRGA